MPTPTTYSYTKAADIPRLTEEIRASGIVTVLDHMNLTGTDLGIVFKDVLSGGDKAALDAIVNAHSGAPLPTPVASINVSSIPAFASKNFGTKNLYKRVVGQQAALAVGDNTINYVETFPWVKFMSLEIMGGETGDRCSLYILDTATGTYSGVPNYQLNQFGFNANIAKDFYAHRSEFDADVYQGLQIKIVYTSLTAKTIGINYVMNEVK